MRIFAAIVASLYLLATYSPTVAADSALDDWALDHALERWVTHCQSTTQYEAEMYECFAGGVAQLDVDLEEELARWLTSTVDDLPRDRAEHEALIRRSYEMRRELAQVECADENFVSRDGTGYGTIYESCLLGKRIEHLRYLTGLARYY